MRSAYPYQMHGNKNETNWKGAPRCATLRLTKPQHVTIISNNIIARYLFDMSTSVDAMFVNSFTLITAVFLRPWIWPFRHRRRRRYRPQWCSIRSNINTNSVFLFEMLALQQCLIHSLEQFRLILKKRPYSNSILMLILISRNECVTFVKRSWVQRQRTSFPFCFISFRFRMHFPFTRLFEDCIVVIFVSDFDYLHLFTIIKQMRIHSSSTIFGWVCPWPGLMALVGQSKNGIFDEGSHSLPPIDYLI